ncbi:hypothetical protein BC01_115 [Bacillus phage BC01]|nr:hypothetical protein BC01_115 [Bacillus phage BC01]
MFLYLVATFQTKRSLPKINFSSASSDPFCAAAINSLISSCVNLKAFAFLILPIPLRPIVSPPRHFYECISSPVIFSLNVRIAFLSNLEICGLLTPNIGAISLLTKPCLYFRSIMVRSRLPKVAIRLSNVISDSQSPLTSPSIISIIFTFISLFSSSMTSHSMYIRGCLIHFKASSIHSMSSISNLEDISSAVLYRRSFACIFLITTLISLGIRITWL